MDNFMDKIAQKLGAQEAIRANAAADAAQIERLEAQVAEYDACIKEMRRLNLRNAENEQKLKEMAESIGGQLKALMEQNDRQMGQLVENGSKQIEQLVEENCEQIRQLAEESNRQIKQITEECIVKLHGAEEKAESGEKEKEPSGQGKEEVQKILEELRAAVLENMTKMEEQFRQSDDFVHKENVKVYRNVQAATAEELEKQTQAVISNQQELAGKNKGLYTVAIWTLVVSLVNLGILIAHLAGLF